MAKQIRINQSELAELLEDEILNAVVRYSEVHGEMRILLQWMNGDYEVTHAILSHMISQQTYYICDSSSPDMTIGCTISVDEILDIVL